MQFQKGTPASSARSPDYLEVGVEAIEHLAVDERVVVPTQEGRVEVAEKHPHVRLIIGRSKLLRAGVGRKKVHV